MTEDLEIFQFSRFGNFYELALGLTFVLFGLHGVQSSWHISDAWQSAFAECAGASHCFVTLILFHFRAE